MQQLQLLPGNSLDEVEFWIVLTTTTQAGLVRPIQLNSRFRQLFAKHGPLSPITHRGGTSSASFPGCQLAVRGSCVQPHLLHFGSLVGMNAI
jgi:hypothetical protein